MCSFRVYRETYAAVTEWLQILQKYNDAYLRENIADFKTRYIQQKAISNLGPVSNLDNIFANMLIDENDYIKPNQSQETSSENRKFDKSDVDLHALELQIFIEPVQTKANLEEELENLSDTLNDFVDIDDDNLIDYIK